MQNLPVRGSYDFSSPISGMHGGKRSDSVDMRIEKRNIKRNEIEMEIAN